jgi:hypothetical protein
VVYLKSIDPAIRINENGEEEDENRADCENSYQFLFYLFCKILLSPKKLYLLPPHLLTR